MTPWAMTAWGAGFRCLAGSTAAGITEFLGGRAFFPVADARNMLMRLTARAGVSGYTFRLFDRSVLFVVRNGGWFFHSGPFGFCEGIFTHMRINHLKDRILLHERTKHGKQEFSGNVPPVEGKREIFDLTGMFPMKPQLSLTVLVDNTTLTDRYFTGEPGLSFFLETAGKKILFDTGYSDVFLRNARMMGISLLDLHTIVLSHGHIDHTGGLLPLLLHMTGSQKHSMPYKAPELIAHPRCFYPKSKGPDRNTGSILSEDEAKRQFSVNLSDKPVWITDDLVFLGEIPRTFTFEKTKPGMRKIILPDGSSEADLLLDDSALAFRSGAGLVIITGCSHAGICNITEYARKICGEQKVADIIGGFHLMASDQKRAEKTGEFLNDLNLEALHACHCTSFMAKLALAKSCPIKEVGVGLRCTW